MIHKKKKKNPYKHSSYKNAQYVCLKSRTKWPMFTELKTLLTSFKGTNYNLSVCVQPNFTVKECHINCKPH